MKSITVDKDILSKLVRALARAEEPLVQVDPKGSSSSSYEIVIPFSKENFAAMYDTFYILKEELYEKALLAEAEMKKGAKK